MKAAILGGTGVYSIDGIQTVEQTVETEFGSVTLKAGTGQWDNLYFNSTFTTITPSKINTFYHGGDSGLKHTPMDEPYCRALDDKILAAAEKRGFPIAESGIYICTNGPRFETPAEIAMYKLWGADYVGMTGATESALAREAGLHFAAVVYSMNWAAGIEENLAFISEDDMGHIKNSLTDIALEVLFSDLGPCRCKDK